MRRRALSSIVLALAFACGGEETAPRAGDAPPAEAAAASAPAAAGDLPLPPEGRVEVSVGVDGIVAVANRAPRRRVLEALARETDLVVVAFVGGGQPEAPVTLRSRGEPIEVVLARALAGVPYSVAPLEPAEGPARLAVIVGWQEETKRLASPPRGNDAPAPAAEQAQEPSAPIDAREALAKLASRDPAERLEAVEFTDISSSAGFEAVVERLANDPDPAVRVAAAESLSDGDVGAVRPLLDALGDGDPRVVTAALESLELVGDESVVPELGAALQHPDASVRERAAEVAEFLE